jgi:thiamine transporter ThiT
LYESFPHWEWRETKRCFISIAFTLYITYAIRKFKENKKELELNGAHQLLVHADDSNFLGKNTNLIIKKKKKNRSFITAVLKLFWLSYPSSCIPTIVNFSLMCIIKAIRLILNKLYLVHVQKGLHKMLMAHLLAHHGQCHSVHKKKCEDHVYFFAWHSLTNIIAEFVKYIFFYISLLYVPHYYCNYCKRCISVRASVLVLYETYLMYPLMRVHVPPGGPETPSSELLLC